MMLSIGDLVLDVTVAPKGPLKVDDDNPATITVGAGGQVAVDLSSAAGLEEYGPPRMVHLLEKLRADLLFATKHEADVLSAPLDRLTKVPVIKLGSGGCSILGEVTTAPVVDEVDTT